MPKHTKIEEMIDRQETIKEMRKQLQEYYFIANPYRMEDRIEESAADYLHYSASIIHSKKKKQYRQGDEKLLSAIEEKDKALHQRRYYEQQKKQQMEYLMQGLSLLEERERGLLEALFFQKVDQKILCQRYEITPSTIRRRSAKALYHLALLLHLEVFKEI